MVDSSHNIFYVLPERIDGNILTLTGEEFLHAKKVLRKKVGDVLVVVDGNGNEYTGLVVQAGRTQIICKIEKIRRKPKEPFIEITIIQSVIKGSRFSTFVEKATEIGVHRIIPVITEHSVKLEGKQHVSRWQRIARSAMKQSGRSVLPEISPIVTFSECLDSIRNIGCKLIADTEQIDKAQHMNRIFDKISNNREISRMKTICAAIGPEGGFSHTEIDLALEHGFKPVTLGERRLRSETAGLVMVTMILLEAGEI